MPQLIVTTIIAIAVIALLFFCYKVFRHYDIFDIGKRKAIDQLPKVAKVLGLEYLPPESEDEIGEIKGFYNGFLIKISRYDPANIAVELNRKMVVEIRSTKYLENPGRMVTFDFMDDALNQFMLTRLSDPDLMTAVSKSSLLEAKLKGVIDQWRADLDGVSIKNNVISARFKNGFQGYVPAEAIEPVIKELVAIAEALEGL